MAMQRLNSRLQKNVWDATSQFVLPHAPHAYSRLALPQTEHIDNPKGYGEGEDARKYDPRLRGVSPTNFICAVFSSSYVYSPLTYVTFWNMHSTRSERVVQPRELDIDPRTGMKNYIANGQTHESTDSYSLTPSLRRGWRVGHE
jgi:hypothetical protein